MITKIRRIVTGHDDRGRAVVLFDGPAPNAHELQGWVGLGATDLWVTDESPATIDHVHDRSMRPLVHDPSPQGSIFRVIEIPPESQGSLDGAAQVFDVYSANKPTDAASARHPTMHRTDSVDYVVILSGEMHMVMDDSEVLVRAGDCIVQQGTYHGWANRSDRPCLAAVILIDGARSRT